jgi:hypothetical protein
LDVRWAAATSNRASRAFQVNNFDDAQHIVSEIRLLSSPQHVHKAYLLTLCTVKQPAGYFRNDSALDACLPCPPGTFASLPGSQRCSRCPAAQVSAAAAMQCVTCPVGSLPNAMSSSCSICDLGFFKSSSSCSTSCCSSCPLNSFSAVADAIACTPCAPNTWLSYREPCIVNYCARGFVNSTQSRSCEACPAGSWQSGDI